ncbi:MAG: response regulator [Planctomycetota bacterium]
MQTINATRSAASSRASRPLTAAATRLAATGLLLGLAIASGSGSDVPAVNQAIVWLPSGAAIALVWLLGLRAVWTVALATALHRLWLDYDLSVAVPEALGSAGEAALGVMVLRRLRFDAECARLRDVLAVCAAAAVAPVVSMVCSWIGRSMPGTTAHSLDLMSGWAGWWRMNALGTVTVLPLALSWSARTRRAVSLRAVAEATAIGLAAVALVYIVFELPLPATTAITLLYGVLPGALYAALRFGPRGAMSVAALTAVFVALATVHGMGPFLAAPFGERHVAAQIFDLTVVCVPLVVGALVAERKNSAAHSQTLELRLRRAQKLEAVGKLAGGVAHDFNNLLTAVQSYAEVVREDSGDEEVRAAALEILAAVDRGASLTRQLLTFSRQQVVSLATLDLTEVIADLASMLRRLLGADIVFNESHQGPAWVRADRSQLQQVLVNLAVNARDAMQRGGALTIATSVTELAGEAAQELAVEPGPYVELSVRDVGIGMTPEVCARVFEPFFTTKAPGEGTGLGLATVYGVVRQSGGAIVLDSAPGQGTHVRIWLPRVAAPSTPTTATAAPEPAPATSATVLLVEDEPTIRDLVRHTLERHGYSVLAAADGAAARTAAHGHAGAIDVLVTDVVMPRMGGVELVRCLADEGRSVPVLFLSGHTPDANPRAMGTAASAFLQKPFAREELLAAVAALVRDSQRAG